MSSRLAALDERRARLLARGAVLREECRAEAQALARRAAPTVGAFRWLRELRLPSARRCVALARAAAGSAGGKGVRGRSLAAAALAALALLVRRARRRRGRAQSSAGAP